MGSAIVSGLLGAGIGTPLSLGITAASWAANKIIGAPDIANINVKGDVGGVLGSKLGSGGTLGGQ